MKHLVRTLIAAAALFIALAISAGLWASAASADPNPSTTPSVTPTLGASGLYMFSLESSQIALHQLNTTNGDASLAYPSSYSTLSINLTGVAQNPLTGVVWAVAANCHLYTVNMTTGALTAGTPSAITMPGAYPWCKGLAIDSQGRFFVGGQDVLLYPVSASIFVADASSAAATQVWNPVNGPETVTYLSFDPVSNNVYFYAVRGAAPTFYGWNSVSSALSVSGVSGVPSANAIAFDPSGVAYITGIDRAPSAAALFANNLSFVGYSNSLDPFQSTLFWYVAPSTPTPTSTGSLAATGNQTLGPFLLALLFSVIGTFLFAWGLIIRQRRA